MLSDLPASVGIFLFNKSASRGCLLLHITALNLSRNLSICASGQLLLNFLHLLTAIWSKILELSWGRRWCWTGADATGAKISINGSLVS